MLISRKRVATVIAAPAQKPVAKTTTVQKPPMNLRPARPVIAGSAADVARMRQRAADDINERLKLISEAFSAIDQAQLVVEEQSKIIEARLKSVNLTEHSDGVYAAKIKEVFSRQSTYIDPKKFRNHVAADVFWACIKVGITDAKEHLTERELAAISDITESKKTGTTFIIERVEKQRRKK